MKKQIIPKKSGLNLSKKTISNLSTHEMSNHIGGNRTHGKKCGGSAVTSSSGWITCKENN